MCNPIGGPGGEPGRPTGVDAWGTRLSQGRAPIQAPDAWAPPRLRPARLGPVATGSLASSAGAAAMRECRPYFTCIREMYSISARIFERAYTAGSYMESP